jgi:hypothetical protein
MPTVLAPNRQRVVSDDVERPTGAASTLAAALLGFFVITFDAVVVNVALPSIRRDLGGGMTGCSGWWINVNRRGDASE